VSRVIKQFISNSDDTSSESGTTVTKAAKEAISGKECD
jgi:hypothetical protein